ncbi:hypothetical protein KUL42_17750 [Alteromonas sp. KUL42]|nr:hypothetical protein KUL42_17750 [Alteromonas sp. KUL42]
MLSGSVTEGTNSCENVKPVINRFAETLLPVKDNGLRSAERSETVRVLLPTNELSFGTETETVN